MSQETQEAQSTYLRAHVGDLQDQLHSAQAELTRNRHELAVRLPPEAVSGLRQQVDEYRIQLDKNRERIAQLDAANTKMNASLGSMTPRPSWKQLKKHGVEVRIHLCGGERKRELPMGVGKVLLGDFCFKCKKTKWMPSIRCER